MELDCREDCCRNCIHAIQTDVDGWVVCQIDNRSKDEDMVCDRYEWNVK